MYLLDTNIYISFYDRYYPKEYFPTFWEKITPIIASQVVIPDVVVNENVQSDWFKQDFLAKNYPNNFLSHKNYSSTWAEVLKYIADNDSYSDKALIGSRSWAHESIADGWIVAMAKKDGYTIVTDETHNANLNVRKPSKNPKVPDVADAFDVRCINRLEFFKEVNLKV